MGLGKKLHNKTWILLALPTEVREARKNNELDIGGDVKTFRILLRISDWRSPPSCARLVSAFGITQQVRSRALSSPALERCRSQTELARRDGPGTAISSVQRIGSLSTCSGMLTTPRKAILLTSSVPQSQVEWRQGLSHRIDIRRTE